MRKGKAELSTNPLAFECAKSECAAGKETGLGRVGGRQNERLVLEELCWRDGETTGNRNSESVARKMYMGGKKKTVENIMPIRGYSSRKAKDK